MVDCQLLAMETFICVCCSILNSTTTMLQRDNYFVTKLVDGSLTPVDDRWWMIDDTSIWLIVFSSFSVDNCCIQSCQWLLVVKSFMSVVAPPCTPSVPKNLPDFLRRENPGIWPKQHHIWIPLNEWLRSMNNVQYRQEPLNAHLCSFRSWKVPYIFQLQNSTKRRTLLPLSPH